MYLIVNDCREAEVVEYLCTVAPHVDRAVFPLALIVKTIHLRGGRGCGQDHSTTIVPRCTFPIPQPSSLIPMPQSSQPSPIPILQPLDLPLPVSLYSLSLTHKHTHGREPMQY